MPDKSNPYGHIPSCQSSSQIALTCPACRWSLLKWSAPRPGQGFDERLTPSDEKWLAEMKISCPDPGTVVSAENRKSEKG